MKSKSLSLYRQSLRVIRDVPILAVRRKIAYNIRELFSIYKESPASKVDEVVNDGIRDLAVLREMLNGRKDSVYNLFKSFENLNINGTHIEKFSTVKKFNSTGHQTDQADVDDFDIHDKFDSSKQQIIPL